jgi:hypothetical protein
MPGQTALSQISSLAAVACLLTAAHGEPFTQPTDSRPRVIATTDGEIDDQCSMVRFLLYANEWDIEGIVTTSSQYHWRGHDWAGDDWIKPYLDAYERVYPNLIKHDPRYPTPGYLRERHALGNVTSEGEMDQVTPGSELIVQVLLDETDPRPVWLQAWGGPNTIARALKSIEEEHPDKVEQVARKLRLFLIWEQDDTYQKYIRPHWERHNIRSIISDQFDAIAYDWNLIIPDPEKQCYIGSWMKQHILENHGPLCSLYKAQENGDFRSEGDSPSFMHCIDTGLRNRENPGWGGWGGRYVRLRNDTWLDPLIGNHFEYPQGRWYSDSSLGRRLRKSADPIERNMISQYYRPMWRWSIAFQNDWAARADWCVTDSFTKANHQPQVKVAGKFDRIVKPGEIVELDARQSTDPDGDALSFKWWRYDQADSATAETEIQRAASSQARFVAPNERGKTVHMILEVTDAGRPPLTRYQRIVFIIE